MDESAADGGRKFGQLITSSRMDSDDKRSRSGLDVSADVKIVAHVEYEHHDAQDDEDGDDEEEEEEEEGEEEEEDEQEQERVGEVEEEVEEESGRRSAKKCRETNEQDDIERDESARRTEGQAEPADRFDDDNDDDTTEQVTQVINEKTTNASNTSDAAARSSTEKRQFGRLSRCEPTESGKGGAAFETFTVKAIARDEDEKENRLDSTGAGRSVHDAPSIVGAVRKTPDSAGGRDTFDGGRGGKRSRKMKTGSRARKSSTAPTTVTITGRCTSAGKGVGQPPPPTMGTGASTTKRTSTTTSKTNVTTNFVRKEEDAIRKRLKMAKHSEYFVTRSRDCLSFYFFFFLF